MSGAFLVFNLIISIAIMIALILVPKFNPALSLVIASIYTVSYTHLFAKSVQYR